MNSENTRETSGVESDDSTVSIIDSDTMQVETGNDSLELSIPWLGGDMND